MRVWETLAFRCGVVAGKFFLKNSGALGSFLVTQVITFATQNGGRKLIKGPEFQSAEFFKAAGS